MRCDDLKGKIKKQIREKANCQGETHVAHLLMSVVNKQRAKNKGATSCRVLVVHGMRKREDRRDVREVCDDGDCTGAIVHR